MPGPKIRGQIVRLAMLLVTAGGLYLLVMPQLEDRCIAGILACLFFIMLAPFVLEEAPTSRHRGHGGREDES